MPSRSTGSRAAPLSDCPLRAHVPVRSTCASAGTAEKTASATTATFLMRLPLRRAWRGVPLRAVRLLLEHRRSEPGRAQVLRIVDLRRDRQPHLAIRALVDV